MTKRIALTARLPLEAAGADTAKNRPVKVDLLGLDLAVLDVDLVSAKDDGDRLANPDNVPVPVGHVLVCHARSHVEHDDRTVALNVVA
jgi:hypothetical protein